MVELRVSGPECGCKLSSDRRAVNTTDCEALNGAGDKFKVSFRHWNAPIVLVVRPAVSVAALAVGRLHPGHPGIGLSPKFLECVLIQGGVSPRVIEVCVAEIFT